jgi:RsmE family RNA methyltransferase
MLADFVMQGSLVRSFQLRVNGVGKRSFQSSTTCHLNRFLFDPSEVSGETKCALLGKDDYRTIHAAKILGVANGDTIRAGVVMDPNHPNQQFAGLKTDVATVEWIPEGKVKKAEILKNGDPPGCLLVKLDQLKSVEDTPTDELLVSLILALPRPLQLGRMLPMISQMGVDQLVLTGARKVPKDYFGSHLFRKPEVLRERLIEGLCQAGDVRLPKIHTVKNLKKFFEEDLDRLFPVDEYARILAHPQRPFQTVEPLRMGDISFPPSQGPPKLVVAVGPEGGWDEPQELDEFEALGFQQVTLGSRTLRSDCAVVSLLGLAHEVCHSKSAGYHS